MKKLGERDLEFLRTRMVFISGKISSINSKIRELQREVDECQLIFDVVKSIILPDGEN